MQTDNQLETDEQLVEQVNRGDHAALARLYDRYASLVYAIAMKVLKDNMAAEDLVHEVFLQFWHRAHSFDAKKGRLPSWLTVMTRNKAIDLLRKSRADENFDDVSAGDFRGSIPQYHAEDFHKARKLMEDLPFDQRNALELAFLQGHTHAEIAEMLKEPLGTIKSRIRIGLLTLKKALGS